MYETILVPLDGSAQGEAVIPHAAELAAKLGSRVVLLRVVRSGAQNRRETMPTMIAGS